MVGRVEFYCANPQHQTWTPGHGVTIHLESWAYCPTGQEDGHVWETTADTSLVELKRRLAKAA